MTLINGYRSYRHFWETLTEKEKKEWFNCLCGGTLEFKRVDYKNDRVNLKCNICGQVFHVPRNVWKQVMEYRRVKVILI